MSFFKRLRSFLRKEKLDADLDDELQFHLDQRTQDFIDEGMTPREARYAARRAFGNVGSIEESTRDAWGFRFLETLWQDVRYAVRLLLKNLTFTLVVVATLALGIGANNAIFSMVNAFLFRPLPVRDADRLMVLATQKQESQFLEHLSYPNFEDLRDRNNVFAAAVAYVPVVPGLSTGEFSSKVVGYAVSGNYFELLGIDAALGRTFLPEEDGASGRDPIVVLSHDFWTHRFGADTTVIGKTVLLNRNSFVVVGVAPRSFRGTDFWVSPHLWIPMSMMEQAGQAGRTNRAGSNFRPFAQNYTSEVTLLVHAGLMQQALRP